MEPERFWPTIDHGTRVLIPGVGVWPRDRAQREADRVGATIINLRERLSGDAAGQGLGDPTQQHDAGKPEKP